MRAKIGTFGIMLLVSLCGCSLLFNSSNEAVEDGGADSDSSQITDASFLDDAALEDATPAAATCSSASVTDDCGVDGVCHCGQCAFSDPSCALSSVRYAIGTSPGGACVAAAVSVESYFQHSCLLRDDGTVWCWGRNCEGQLGDHTVAAPETDQGCQQFSNVPVQVLTSAGGPPLGGVRQIQTGIFSTCAVLNDRTVWCWGGNADGQLGSGADPDAVPVSLSPVQVVTAAGAPLVAVRDIGSGTASMCAVDDNRDMWCWGANSAGQLQMGVGDFVDRNAATKVAGSGLWQHLDGGGNHMCASRNIDNEGETLWCWGQDIFGSLGNGEGANPNGTVCDVDNENLCFPTAEQVITFEGTELTNPSLVALGNTFSCAATTGPTTLRCWGENSEHALGDESNLANLEFGNSQFVATRVVLDVDQSTIQALAAGAAFACAIVDNDLHCWGSDSHGQQGNGPSPAIWRSPSSTPLLTDVRDLTAGFNHACTILADRTVQCWGANGSGQLGLGDDIDRDAPTTVISDYICP